MWVWRDTVHSACNGCKGNLSKDGWINCLRFRMRNPLTLPCAFRVSWAGAGAKCAWTLEAAADCVALGKSSTFCLHSCCSFLTGKMEVKVPASSLTARWSQWRCTRLLELYLVPSERCPRAGRGYWPRQVWRGWCWCRTTVCIWGWRSTCYPPWILYRMSRVGVLTSWKN